MARIALVGAGYIARIHADALRALPGHTLACVIDPNASAAERLAQNAGAAVFADVAAALDANAFDRAHVLVPPDLHARVAEPILRAGKPVLLEKPLAATGEGCTELLAAAETGRAALGVNQNFVHHPAFVRLRALVQDGSLGRPRSVSCLYNVVLRQLAARQFSHWMFATPVNILLEQAVHPLSQMLTLAGDVRAVRSIAGPALPVGSGRAFHPTLDALLDCTILPAQMRFAVGENFPFWRLTVVCDDGVAVADILADRVVAHRRTKWLDAVDGVVSGARTGLATAREGARGAAQYVLSTAGLRPRSDPFFLSMLGAIRAFHEAVDAASPPVLDGAFGARLVAICERLARDAYPAATPQPVAFPAQPRADNVATEVAILGGTGFIGGHTVRAFLAAGHPVAVMARGLGGLPEVFADPRVTLHRGDIRDADAVARAIAGAKVVVNLAHGGGGADFAAVRAAMVGGAETVARACLAIGARLVHVGSIASLYLGPQSAPVTGATPPDPEETRRADYARAKVLADRALLDLCAREKLRLVILRPGVVVGEGGPPFHSGVGLFNAEQHAIGWNAGDNPLPFVLAEDVADAIVRAAFNDGVEGQAYNLVGDVRLSAREYIAALAKVTGRPLRFHPQSATWLWLEDTGKWVVKRAAGRKVAAPSRRDFLSRGMAARFDITDAQRDLGWHPVADRDVFLARAVAIHAPS